VGFVVCILATTLLCGCTGNGDEYNVTIFLSNLRDNQVIFRVTIDDSDLWGGILDTFEDKDRNFKVSQGSHTFKFYINGAFYQSQSRSIEEDIHEDIFLDIM
jgi:hypothetical protein